MAYAAVIDAKEIAEKKMGTFRAAMKLREERIAKAAAEKAKGEQDKARDSK